MGYGEAFNFDCYAEVCLFSVHIYVCKARDRRPAQKREGQTLCSETDDGKSVLYSSQKHIASNT